MEYKLISETLEICDIVINNHKLISETLEICDIVINNIHDSVALEYLKKIKNNITQMSALFEKQYIQAIKDICEQYCDDCKYNFELKD